MLDIVMTAHAPNFKLMARRELEMNGAQTKEVILGSLVSTVNLVGHPGKVILSLEGGDRQQFEAAEAYLQEQALTWQIIHNEGEITTYRAALMRGLEQCQSPFVAVVPPWIEVKDSQWVHRMMWAMGRDQTALLVGTYPEQGAAKDLAPHVVTARQWPGGGFFVARRDKLWENIRLGTEEDLHVELAKTAALNGWRLWCHPGVRFATHEHENHQSQAEVAVVED